MIKLKSILIEASPIIQANLNTDANEKFRKLMKKNFPSDAKFNLTKGYGEYLAAIQKWFTSNITKDPKILKLCMKPYEFSTYSGSSRTISYKGKKYNLSTAWDTWDYLFDMLVDNGLIKYKKKFDVAADREQRKKEFMQKYGE